MKCNNKNIILAFKKKLFLFNAAVVYDYYFCPYYIRIIIILFLFGTWIVETQKTRVQFFLLNPLSAAPIGKRASFSFYRRRNVITIINRIHLTITSYYYYYWCWRDGHCRTCAVRVCLLVRAGPYSVHSDDGDDFEHHPIDAREIAVESENAVLNYIVCQPNWKVWVRAISC